MTIRVFVSGQSNALGRSTGGPDWSGISSGVRVWNNINPLGSPGSAFVSAAEARAGGTFENTNRGNFAVWFCDRLARETGQPVDMVIVARGASSIIEWGASGFTYPLRQACINTWAGTGAPAADIFLWHQGEGDASTMPHEEWVGRFNDLVAALTDAGVLSAATKILLGGIADQLIPAKAYFNRKVLRKMAAVDARTGYADAQGLATYDGTHFTAESLYRLGSERYYRAYLEAKAMSIFALVNEGGTPGEPGTGENKILDMSPLLNAGFRLRGVPVYITTSQTYEPDPEVVAIMVEVTGGGGGGGGASSTGGVARAGLGGGAGGYAMAVIESPAASYAVTIGAGGSGGAAGQNAGTGGGATAFGTVVSATGGGAGAASGGTADQVVYGATLGGEGSGGEINLRGAASVPGFKLSADQRMSGGGGSSRFGAGGPNRVGTAISSGGPGNAATGYGSGGGGAVSSSTADHPGGDGTAGIVVVWEFIR